FAPNLIASGSSPGRPTSSQRSTDGAVGRVRGFARGASDLNCQNLETCKSCRITSALAAGRTPWRVSAGGDRRTPSTSELWCVSGVEPCLASLSFQFRQPLRRVLAEIALLEHLHDTPGLDFARGAFRISLHHTAEVDLQLAR